MWEGGISKDLVGCVKMRLSRMLDAGAEKDERDEGNWKGSRLESYRDGIVSGSLGKSLEKKV